MSRWTPGAREAIQTNYGITSANVFGNIDTNVVCLHLSGNTFSHGGGAPDDFRLRKRFEATVRLPGYADGTGQDATSLAEVVAFIVAQNTGSAGEPGSAAASGTGGGYTGGAACTLPRNELTARLPNAPARSPRRGQRHVMQPRTGTDTSSPVSAALQRPSGEIQSNSTHHNYQTTNLKRAECARAPPARARTPRPSSRSTGGRRGGGGGDGIGQRAAGEGQEVADGGVHAEGAAGEGAVGQPHAVGTASPARRGDGPAGCPSTLTASVTRAIHPGPAPARRRRRRPGPRGRRRRSARRTGTAPARVAPTGPGSRWLNGRMAL